MRAPMSQIQVYFRDFSYHLIQINTGAFTSRAFSLYYTLSAVRLTRITWWHWINKGKLKENRRPCTKKKKPKKWPFNLFTLKFFSGI